MPKRTAIVTIVVLALMGAAARLDAAAYYVSPSGSAAWPTCTNIATPCAPATAFANAVAGDTVYFRGGSYNQTAQYGDGGALPLTPYQPAHSGTSSAWITFKAYPGEAPIINGYVSLSRDGSNFTGVESGTAYPLNQSECIGVRYQSYIVIDGFTIYANGGTQLGVGKVTVWYSPYVIVRNMTFNGGRLLPVIAGTTSYDNTESVRIEGSDHVAVTNCRFNGPRIAVGTDGYENHNVSTFKLYNTNFVAMDHLDITNSTNPIYVKSHHNNDLTITNNFIHDCYAGLLISMPISNSYGSTDRGTIANNVIVNLTAGSAIGFDGDMGIHGDDWVIANNTFYKNGSAFGLTAAESGHGYRTTTTSPMAPIRIYTCSRERTTIPQTGSSRDSPRKTTTSGG